MKIYDDFADNLESFSKRKDRRKPKGRRSVHDLRVDDKTTSSASKFSDPNLQTLYELGHISELLGELKSGKEATVYLAVGPQGLLAAKIYRDISVRSFKNDKIYRTGRYIGDTRAQKAIEKRSKAGLAAQQALWVAHEYRQLWELQQAGIPVPKPAVGPGSDDVSQAGSVVLMEFIGDEDGAAPRLSDVRLDPQEAGEAFTQSLDIMVQLLRLGKVHGDYSTYNLLWWQGKVIVIDLPQMVNCSESTYAWQLLDQDVRSLCTSFRRLGIRADPHHVLSRVKDRAKRSVLAYKGIADGAGGD